MRELEPIYERVTGIMGLPFAEFGPQMEAFNAQIQQDPNPLVQKFFGLFDRCRQREFACMARLALVRAATEYKLHGEAGLKSVTDPFGSGPFAFRRFAFEGVDRGFELKSAYKGTDNNGLLIFVEKDGPPFRIDGKNAGKAVENGNARK